MSPLVEVVARWPVQELLVSSLNSEPLQPSNWAHYRTDCRPPSQCMVGHEVGREGATVWVSTDGPMRAVIAWEWIEISGGILVLADPVSLASNLHFVGNVEGMESLNAKSRKVLLLNAIVHSLRWQERVLAEVGERLSSASASSTTPTPLH